MNSVFNPGATMVNGGTCSWSEWKIVGDCPICAPRGARTDSPTGKLIACPHLSRCLQQCPEETWGIEDPRVTWIEELGLWVIAYTAYSEVGPPVSLASTKDFVNFRGSELRCRLKTKTPHCSLSSLTGDMQSCIGLSRHGAWENTSGYLFHPILKHWGDHQVALTARQGGWWDANKIGLSPPPLETSEGWLILYHGVKDTVDGSIYRLGLALLDREDPTRVLRRTDRWIFGPEEPYERSGDVGNVVFPCGWTLQGDELHLYYGCADSCVAVAGASLSDVLD